MIINKFKSIIKNKYPHFHKCGYFLQTDIITLRVRLYKIITTDIKRKNTIRNFLINCNRRLPKDKSLQIPL